VRQRSGLLASGERRVDPEDRGHVIARDETQIGRTALDMYRERVANPAGPARTIVMPTMLIARGSGEVPP
jgi:DNA-binding LacI/PurR family transcriptional regulator